MTVGGALANPTLRPLTRARCVPEAKELDDWLLVLYSGLRRVDDCTLLMLRTSESCRLANGFRLTSFAFGNLVEPDTSIRGTVMGGPLRGEGCDLESDVEGRGEVEVGSSENSTSEPADVIEGRCEGA